MTESDDTPTRTVYPTDPEAKLYSFKRTPSKIEQALEAARDDLTEREFLNLLHSIGGVSPIVDGRDEPWRPTRITLECHSEAMQCSRATRDLLTIARRAGWRLRSVGFNRRNQLVLEERDSE